jgi:hypothetical protein
VESAKEEEVNEHQKNSSLEVKKKKEIKRKLV